MLETNLDGPLRSVLLATGGDSLTGALAGAFADVGFVPAIAFTGDQMREFSDARSFDIIVADERLDPGATGLVSCGRVWDGAVRVYVGEPRGAMPPAVHAVIPRDVAALEIVIRASALLELRGGPAGDGQLPWGPLHLDLGRREARWNGARVELTPTQFRILVVLARARGAVVTKSELQREVWPWSAPDAGERLVAHIRRIRAKLECDPSKPSFLVTSRGEGFRLADFRADERAAWNDVDPRPADGPRAARKNTA